MRQGNQISFCTRLTTFFASRMLLALSMASGWWRLATTGFPISRFIASMP